MKYYDIKGTDLSVSAVIMGCMRIDALPLKDIDTLVHTALDNGINFFDHADVYAAGECEKLFGKVVTPSMRDKMLVQGKCGIKKCGGYLDGYYDFSKDYILRCVDEILERLGMDYLDTLLLHRPDSLMEPDEIAEAFEILEKSGKVRYFGLSNTNSQQIELIQSALKQKLQFIQVQFGIGHTPLVDAGMSPNMFNNQAPDRTGYLLEYARLHHLTLQSWSPFQHGTFAGVVIGDRENYSKLNEVLDRLAEKYGVTPTSIAAAWILRHPARIQMLTGTTKPSRMIECCKGADITLQRDEWYELYKAAGNPIP